MALVTALNLSPPWGKRIRGSTSQANSKVKGDNSHSVLALGKYSINVSCY